MIISAVGLGKKYDRNWIFRDLTITIDEGERIAITGKNGSGKSTLLRIIAGSLSPTSGTVSYASRNASIPPDESSQRINFCAPYIELPEEFSLRELLSFHSTFRKSILDIDAIIDRMGYPSAADKQISQYSSGMKQRVRLVLAFFFEADIIALDEPTSNLDEAGIAWYQQEIAQIPKNKTIIISSNQRYEYDCCKKSIELELR
jgi:ABC-type multidrug transport system ATPase subunit